MMPIAFQQLSLRRLGLWFVALAFAGLQEMAYSQALLHGGAFPSLAASNGANSVEDSGSAPLNASLGAALPIEAGEQLEKQSRAMEAIYLEFEETREPVDADHPLAKKEYVVYFEGVQFYERRHTVVSEAGGEQTTQDMERSFDGSLAYTGDPRQAARSRVPILKIYSITDKTDPDRFKFMFPFPYLDAAGFYAPQFLSDLSGVSYVQPLVLFYLNRWKSTQVKNVNGNISVRALVPEIVYKDQNPVIRIRNISLLLDPKHGYAVAERDELSDTGQLLSHVQSKDWKYYEDAKIWLPSLCVETYYSSSGRLTEVSETPICSITLRLHEVKFGHQDISFDLASAPTYREAGTQVSDRAVPEALTQPLHQVLYTVAANGKLLRVAVAGVMSRSRFVVVFLVIIALPPIIFLLRQRRVIVKR
jgi:hypothetical protein